MHSRVPLRAVWIKLASCLTISARPAHGFVLYDGMAASDIIWEADMFRLAPAIAGAEGLAGPTFDGLMIGLAPGPVNTWSDFRIHSDHGLARLPGRLDMLFIGSALPEKQAALIEECAFTCGIAALATSGCRIVAIGSASMILAELGMLDGRRATVRSVAAQAFRSSYMRNPQMLDAGGNVKMWVDGEERKTLRFSGVL